MTPNEALEILYDNAHEHTNMSTIDKLGFWFCMTFITGYYTGWWMCLTTSLSAVK